jgi:hypothetical protein
VYTPRNTSSCLRLNCINKQTINQSIIDNNNMNSMSVSLCSNEIGTEYFARQAVQDSRHGGNISCACAAAKGILADYRNRCRVRPCSATEHQSGLVQSRSHTGKIFLTSKFITHPSLQVTFSAEPLKFHSPLPSGLLGLILKEINQTGLAPMRDILP